LPRLMLTICILLVSATAVTAGGVVRQYGGLYTRERLASIRANCEKYAWARQARDKAVEAAAPWLTRGDEELWRMVPGQNLPRCIDVSWDYNRSPRQVGCLKCGSDIFKYGNYPYEPDFDKLPWKLTCPSCGAVFPTNDFGRYYESGIDAQGLFNPSHADRSLLYNTAHPDPKDPLHTWGMDDGFGYLAGNGRTYKFIGYYTWQLWEHIRLVVDALADAYVYTGDPAYARKAAILLDRIADVYPSMDWKPYADRGWFHSDGGSHRGKIDGSIWECSMITGLARSYDMILSGTVDNPELYAFLTHMGEVYKLPSPKGTRQLFVRNVDDNLLRCGMQAVLDRRANGNAGMHQQALAQAAIALNTEPETCRWLDWLFKPDGGALPGVIVGGMDRDGCGGEGAPGYSLSWGINIGQCADLLTLYGHYHAHDIYRDFPQFRRAITAPYDLLVLGYACPPIGDSGGTGQIDRGHSRPDLIARGFEITGDPAAALAAYHANSDTVEGLHGSITGSDPGELPRRIEKIAASTPAAADFSRNLPGFGLASLELGKGRAGQALWCYYGRSDHHGHVDRLNIGLYAWGVDLAPDLGYPEFAAGWPHSDAWSNNTISHNTVTVDGLPQQERLTGTPTLFKSLDGLKLLEVESPEVYPGIKTYARALAFVRTPEGDAYALDVFRVEGGHEHLLSFHGPAGPVTTTGLTLTDQKGGTYAGPDVPDRLVRKDVPLGYSFLYNVSRDMRPPEAFDLDWKAQTGYRGVTDKDDIHIRLHVRSEISDVALADGDPPQNKPNNPRRLRYSLLRRTGKDLKSTFVSVLEPWRGKPFITSVTRLDAGSPERVALRVELADGCVDTLLFNPSGGQMQAGGVTLDGRWAFVRTGSSTRAAMADAKSLRWAAGSRKAAAGSLKATAAFTGRIVKMDHTLRGSGDVVVDADIPSANAVVGQQIFIENDRVLNACYTIHAAQGSGHRWRLNLGPVSFARSFKDPADYSKGMTMNFQEGARFRIPNHATMQTTATDGN